MNNWSAIQKWLFGFTMLFTLCVYSPAAYAVCCDDYKSEGPGGCNIFGCNCDRGCKVEHTKADCLDKCRTSNDQCYLGCENTGIGPAGEEAALACEIRICERDHDACTAACDQKYPAVGNANKKALATFTKYDSTQDAHLDQNEFYKMVDTEFGGKHNDKFHEMDKNKDGRISLEEAGIPLPEKLEKRHRMPPPK